jgi:hypothetical protein
MKSLQEQVEDMIRAIQIKVAREKNDNDIRFLKANEIINKHSKVLQDQANNFD